MLALTRYPNEQVRITLLDGRRITIAIVAIRSNGAVRLAFDAPADIRIDREEVARRMEGFNGR